MNAFELSMLKNMFPDIKVEEEQIYDGDLYEAIEKCLMLGAERDNRVSPEPENENSDSNFGIGMCGEDDRYYFEESSESEREGSDMQIPAIQLEDEEKDVIARKIRKKKRKRNPQNEKVKRRRNNCGGRYTEVKSTYKDILSMGIKKCPKSVKRTNRLKRRKRRKKKKKLQKTVTISPISSEPSDSDSSQPCSPRPSLYDRSYDDIREEHDWIKSLPYMEARGYQKRLEKLKTLMKLMVFEECNYDRDNTKSIDLHGLTVKEALYTFTEFCDRLREMSGSKKKECAQVIVGRGIHSKNGGAKIKPAIKKEILERGLRFRYQKNNDGVFVVTV